MARGKATTSGGMLWLAVGAGQLVYVVAFITCYRNRVPPPTSRLDQIALWFLPQFAATLALLIPLFCYRLPTEWRLLFTVAVVLLGLVILDFFRGFHYHYPEQSLVNLSASFWLGIFVIGAACLSLDDPPYPGWPQRRVAHWAGILVALLPTIWFMVGFSCHWVGPGELSFYHHVLE